MIVDPPDGWLKVDSEHSRTIGFTSDKFDKLSVLWKQGKEIHVGFLASLRPGNFARLQEGVERNGYVLVLSSGAKVRDLSVTQQKTKEQEQ